MNVGTGSIVILHDKGWSCTNEAIFDVDIEIMPDKSAKRKGVISLKKLFDVNGKLENNTPVEAVFKYDTGAKVAFKATVQGTSLQINGEINNNFETILTKISQWQSIKENY